MESTIFNIRKSFLRNAICVMMMGAVLPVAAQDDMDDPEGNVVAVARKPAVEKYQLMTVKGKVVDEATKAPLGGIQIQMLGNSKYTAMSDDDGTFAINVPVFATSLYVYSEEFLSQQVAIGDGKEEVLVYMLSDKYGKMYDKSTTITASRSITSEKPGYFTIDNEIGNRLGGDVRSLQRSGTPTIGSSMFVRGINSINANAQPLIIVDGVELDMQFDATSLHSGHFNNLLSTVAASDIEKVTVLKNATALYGARGANGVILIETKRGHSMATRIDADITVGLSLIPRLPTMMNASQYRTYATELLGTIDGTENMDFNFLNDSPDSYYYNMYHNNTDWSKEVYRNALTQNYSISVQGGDNVGMYNLSLGYADANSTAEGTDWSRMNVRFNTDITVWKNLSTKFNLAISRSTSHLFDDGASADVSEGTPTSITFLGLIKSPLLSPYQYNATINGFTELPSVADELFSPLGEGYSLANPVGILEEGEGENKNYTENTNLSIQFEPTLKITDDLKLTSLFNYSLNRVSELYTRPGDVVPSFQVPYYGYVYNGFSTLYSKQTNVLSNTHLDYSHNFGAHTLAAFAGFRYNYFYYRSDELTTQYYSLQDNKSPNHSAGTNNYFTIGGLDETWKQMQWYGNVDYNYKNRYFATVSVLFEANSRFGDNCDGLGLFGVKWAVFPSVQLGWVATNEAWFPKNTGIDYLRVNVGYDMSGNDDIGSYAARTLYTSVKFNKYANGLLLTNIGNDKIKWETSYKFNAGFQAYLLHNRIGVSFDYFYSTTKDLLTYRSFTTPISGNGGYWANNGELKNTGFEVSLSGKPVVMKDWQVEVGASVGHYKNEVTKLAGDSYTSSIYGTDNILTSVGNPVAMFYGYKTEGVFASDADAKAAGKDGNYLYFEDSKGVKQEFKAGDVHFVDKNGDGMITEEDRFIIGDPNPDIYGNIFATVNWKDFTLSMNFNYSLGNDIYNYQRMLLNSGSNFYNQQVATTGRWRYENQVTDMPRSVYGDPMGNNRMSDRWIEDGSYLRLKTLTLSYRVPVYFSWLQGLTVTAEAINLFTLTKYLGSDPEFSINNGVMYQGIDCGNVAQGRAFTLGLKINL